MPLSITADHAQHDPNLIAGHLAGDLVLADRSHAEALLAGCAECAQLRSDLVALTAATRLLPAAARTSRDFRLTPEQAARLRRGSWLRRVLAPFGASRSGVRPLAAALTSLGLAGLFVATVLPGFLGSSASMGAPGQERDLTTAAGPTSAPVLAPGAPGAGASSQTPAAQGAGAPSQAPALGASGGPIPAATGGETTVKTDAGGSAAPETSGDTAYLVPPSTGSPSDPSGELNRLSERVATINPFVLGSIVLLVVGLVLFGLRLAARRLR